MKRLVPIAPPHIDRHRSIVNDKKVAKTKVQLQSLDAQVAARYAEFEAAIHGGSIQSFTEKPALQAMGDKLRTCYAIKTKNLRRILQGIKSAQPRRLLEKCPYCGITLPATYDHYLPASKYPELVVHGLNLVPCCSSCNEKKGNRWRSGRQRLFIHFYSDAIPKALYLHVLLVSAPTAKSLGAKFIIKRPAAITKCDWATIENHYSKLYLLNRYSEFANEEITNMLDVCADHICDGGSNAANFLNRVAGRLEVVFGRNHWRIVLYRALASSRLFLDIVQSKAKIECDS